MKPDATGSRFTSCIQAGDNVYTLVLETSTACTAAMVTSYTEIYDVANIKELMPVLIVTPLLVSNSYSQHRHQLEWPFFIQPHWEGRGLDN